MLNNESIRENYGQVGTRSTSSAREQIYEEFAPRPFECAGILDRIHEKRSGTYMLKIRNGECTAVVNGISCDVIDYGIVYYHIPSKSLWYIVSGDKVNREHILVFDRFQNTLRYSFFDGMTEYASNDNGYLFAYFEAEPRGNGRNFIVSISSFPKENANLGGIISGRDEELIDHILASFYIVKEGIEDEITRESGCNQ